VASGQRLSETNSGIIQHYRVKREEGNGILRNLKEEKREREREREKERENISE